MPLSRIATTNLKDYDIYVKIIVNVNDDVEYQICNNSDDMVCCGDIYTTKELVTILEDWGIVD